MREVRREALQAEILRLGSLVVQTWIHHPSGVLLHAPGDVLGSHHAAALEAAGVEKLMLLEAMEDRAVAQASLGVIALPLQGLSRLDALAEDVVGPGGQFRARAGTALEPEVVESMTREKVSKAYVCTTSTLGAIAEARRYLEAAPAAPPKIVRPDPAGAAATTCAWSLLTPRAKVLVVIPDDLNRLRIVNALLASGHEALQAKESGDAQDLVNKERPDAVLVAQETALRVCGVLRRKGELARSIAICVAAESTKLTGLALKAFEAGANDVMPLQVTPALMADRARAWLHLRNKIVGFAPSIVKERRRTERSPATMTLRLSDPATGKALPVASATLLDFSDGGLRLEYGLLEPPDPGQYRLHTVHPRHPLYAYAKENPMGHDFLLELTGTSVPAFEAHGRFTHLSLVTGSERAGVAFIRRQEGATERITTIRRKPNA